MDNVNDDPAQTIAADEMVFPGFGVEHGSWQLASILRKLNIHTHNTRSQQGKSLLALLRFVFITFVFVCGPTLLRVFGIALVATNCYVNLLSPQSGFLLTV